METFFRWAKGYTRRPSRSLSWDIEYRSLFLFGVGWAQERPLEGAPL